MQRSSHAPLRTPRGAALTSALALAGLVLAGCNRNEAPPPQAAAPAPTPALAPAAAPAPVAPAAAPVQAAYTPPTAEALYQMVAPIALYPDKLIAQVLAASTFPDQVTAAQGWLKQNAGLKGGPLADAANQQPWDPSVKALTAFRPALDQLANNIPWTTALGQAYYNDPNDVMNAIQVMRLRAQKAGELKSSKQLRVAQASSAPPMYPSSAPPPSYGGPVIVEPPPTYITIEPAQPDVVYVPAYDPRAAYGEPVPYYAGYEYSPPVYWAEPQRVNPVVVGALAFGTGIVVSSALQRHDWGWRNWDMYWGRPGWRDRDRGPDRRPPGWDRPTVVFNNNVWMPPPRMERGPRFGPGGNPQALLQAQQMQQQAQQQQLAQQQAQAARQQQAQMLQAQQAQQARQAQMAQQQQQGRMQQLQAQQQQEAQRAQQMQQQMREQQMQAMRHQQQQQQQMQQMQQRAQQQAQQAQMHQQQQQQQQAAQARMQQMQQQAQRRQRGDNPPQ